MKIANCSQIRCSSYDMLITTLTFGDIPRICLCCTYLDKKDNFKEKED